MVRGALGYGDMLFAVVDLNVAAGINKDLFFMTFAGGQAYKNRQEQKGVEFLHSHVSFSREKGQNSGKRPAPAMETGLDPSI
jgi:hypothetical protein